MQELLKRAADKLVDWAVPAACAALLIAWGNLPHDVRHYWPIMIVALIAAGDSVATFRNRRDIKSLRAIHAAADEREEAMRQRDDAIAKAFRAMLDDSMANLYAACVQRRYTTEDDRRRYNRLHTAYTGMGGNGEAVRRKVHFDALPDEETWTAARVVDKKEDIT